MSTENDRTKLNSLFKREFTNIYTGVFLYSLPYVLSIHVWHQYN